MAIIFDEVTAEVQPPTPAAPLAPQSTDAGPRNSDANALCRELQRQAERQLRLRAD